MTRIFDSETGVVTPVTVIEAAPCPVVQVKTADADGYDAVQIAYDEAAERKVSKAELGHLKKNNVSGAYRGLLELRGQSELIVGENVTVEAFEPGEKVKVSGISHGKGFGDSLARVQGNQDGRPHGREAHHAGGTGRPRGPTGREPSAGQGRSAGAQERLRRSP